MLARERRRDIFRIEQDAQQVAEHSGSGTSVVCIELY